MNDQGETSEVLSAACQDIVTYHVHVPPVPCSVIGASWESARERFTTITAAFRSEGKNSARATAHRSR
jgi:hypothetical protein